MSLLFRIVSSYVVLGGAGTAGAHAVVNNGGLSIWKDTKETKEEVIKPGVTVTEEKVTKVEEQKVEAPQKKEEVVETTKESKAPVATKTNEKPKSTTTVTTTQAANENQIRTQNLQKEAGHRSVGRMPISSAAFHVR